MVAFVKTIGIARKATTRRGYPPHPRYAHPCFLFPPFQLLQNAYRKRRRAGAKTSTVPRGRPSSLDLRAQQVRAGVQRVVGVVLAAAQVAVALAVVHGALLGVVAGQTLDRNLDFMKDKAKDGAEKVEDKAHDAKKDLEKNKAHTY
jgi:hypothetical protein